MHAKPLDVFFPLLQSASCVVGRFAELRSFQAISSMKEEQSTIKALHTNKTCGFQRLDAMRTDPAR